MEGSSLEAAEHAWGGGVGESLKGFRHGNRLSHDDMAALYPPPARTSGFFFFMVRWRGSNGVGNRCSCGERLPLGAFEGVRRRGAGHQLAGGRCEDHSYMCERR